MQRRLSNNTNFFSGRVFLRVTQDRAFSMFVFIMLLAASAAIFIILNQTWRFVPDTMQYLARERANFTYWLIYKPHGAQAAAAQSQSPGIARSIPVLLYHGEGAGSDMPTGVFVQHLQALKAAGWNTITMKQFENFMKDGASIPDHSFLLTFDDGRKDTFYNADPVLKDLGYTGVMFVITGFSLPPGGTHSTFYLDQSELQYMQESGRWDLESHGDQDHRTYKVQSTTDLSLQATTIDGHFLSNKLWNAEANRFETDAEFEDRVRGDLQTSKDTLENAFGLPVIGYAYPFNDHGQQTSNFPGSSPILERVVPSIYEFGFYQISRGDPDTFNYPGPRQFLIKRIEPNANWSTDDLLNVMSVGDAKQLPWSENSFATEWIGVWGTVTSGTQLSLSATPITEGATAFLNGSGWWRDYLFTAKVVKHAGGSIVLIARNKDDANNLACSFNDGSVRLERRASSGNTLLATSEQNAYANDGSASIGIGVTGSTVSCYITGALVLSATSALDEASVGGVGVEVWDSKKGVASSEFDSMDVRPL